MYIWDLENTLTNSEHRNHLAKAKKWDEFHELMPQDLPRRGNMRLFQICNRFDRVIILTGMPERHRSKAETWLMKYSLFPDEIIMRPNGDLTPSGSFKLKVVKDRKFKPVMIFDDRIDVVDIFLTNKYPAIMV